MCWALLAASPIALSHFLSMGVNMQSLFLMERSLFFCLLFVCLCVCMYVDDASQVSGKSDDTATGASSSSSSATDEEKRKKKRKKKKVASSGEDQNPPPLLSSSSDAKPHPQKKPVDATTPTATEPSDEGVEPVAEDDVKPHPQEKPVSLTESCATTPTATSITEPSDEGVGLVAEEEVGAVARDDDGTAKRKLHTCASCSVEEHEAKTFKRCQR